MTNVKPYTRLTPAEIITAMNKQAAAYCLAVATAYLNVPLTDLKWENLLRDTADNIQNLVRQLRETRRDAKGKEPPQENTN